jgi:hypothetical protein
MGWGENGFVRILRGSSGGNTTGSPGQCGIARSPSVALGGILLFHQESNPPPNSMQQQQQQRGRGDDSIDDDSRHVRIGHDDGSSIELEPVTPYTLWEEFCLHTGQRLDDPSSRTQTTSRCANVADWIATHQAIVLGVIGVWATLLVVVWPLTSDCRRRAYRRRMRKMLQQQQQQQQQECHNESTEVVVVDEELNETSPLLGA